MSVTSHEGFRVSRYKLAALNQYKKQYAKDNLNELIDDAVANATRLQGMQPTENFRSRYRVDKLYEALQRYSPLNQPRVIESVSLRAGIALAYTAFARKEGWPLLNVLPLSYRTMDIITSNPTGSAGLTNFGHKKQDSYEVGLERAHQTLVREIAAQPCIAFKRTQFNDKTRLVWGYPYSMTIVEGLVAYPLIDLFKRSNTPMAFAKTSGAIGTKLRVSSYHKRYAYSLDMSQFDSSVSRYLIRIAFRILKTWFDLQEVEPTTGKTVDEIFDVIEGYFVFTPIVMPDGNLYRGKEHGVPSGSFFTQIVDSIVNVILCGAVSHHFALNVDKADILVLGDDLLFWSNRLVDLDSIANFCKSQFGIKVHGSEKSKVFNYTETIHFLGRDWVKGQPDLAQDEILQRMWYPETFRKYSSDEQAKDKQVRLLLLSHAANYKGGWNIVRQVMGSDRWYLQGAEYCDSQGYLNPERLDIPEEGLTGLQRYIRRYVSEENASNFSTTAMLYWL